MNIIKNILLIFLLILNGQETKAEDDSKKFDFKCSFVHGYDLLSSEDQKKFSNITRNQVIDFLKNNINKNEMQFALNQINDKDKKISFENFEDAIIKIKFIFCNKPNSSCLDLILKILKNYSLPKNNSPLIKEMEISINDKLFFIFTNMSVKLFFYKLPYFNS